MNKESSYNPDYFESLFKTEDEHFWFVSRNRLIASFVEKFLVAEDGKKTILEIGCGTGNVLKGLAKNNPAHQVIGMDLYREGLLLAKKRGNLQTMQANLFHAPFHHSVHLAGVFDVLEHFQEDELVLQRIQQMLVSGGYLVLTVPAFMSLWSYFDEEAHHARRYRKEDLRQKIEKAGFHVRYLSYSMMSLFPFVWLARRVPQPVIFDSKDEETEINRQKVENELRVIPVANQIALSVLNLETSLIMSGRSLPFGTSLIAVAEKID